MEGAVVLGGLALLSAWLFFPMALGSGSSGRRRRRRKGASMPPGLPNLYSSTLLS